MSAATSVDVVAAGGFAAADASVVLLCVAIGAGVSTCVRTDSGAVGVGSGVLVVVLDGEAFDDGSGGGCECVGVGMEAGVVTG